MPASASTASKVSESFPSRSRRKNRNCSSRFSRCLIRFRTCWATQSRFGCPVTPRMCTRRVEASMTNSTYNRLQNAVSTGKKSQANKPGQQTRQGGQQDSITRSSFGRRSGAGARRAVPQHEQLDVFGRAAQQPQTCQFQRAARQQIDARPPHGCPSTSARHRSHRGMPQLSGPNRSFHAGQA